MEVTITIPAEKVIERLYIRYLAEHPLIKAADYDGIGIQCFKFYVEHVLRDMYNGETEPIEWEVD